MNINILILTIPLMLSNLTTPLVGIADTAVAGHFLNIESIAAIGLGAIAFDFLYWSFSFLKFSTSGLVARNIGSQNFTNVNIVFSRNIYLALIFAISMLIFKPYIVQACLYMLNPQENIFLLTKIYIDSRIFSAPAVLVNYVMLGYFIATQQTHQIFYYSLLINISNILLNLLFVSVFKWGILGISLASVISQYIALLFNMYFLFNVHKKVQLVINQWQLIFNRKVLLSLLTMNFNILVRTFSLMFVFFLMAKQGSQFGTVILASNMVLIHFQTTMAYTLDAFSDVAEGMTGKSYGAKNREEFIQLSIDFFKWMLIYSILVACVYKFFGEQMLYIFSEDEILIDTAKAYFIWMILSPFASFICFLLDGIFIGTLHTKEMRNAMIISAMVFLVSSYFFSRTWGNHGLWLAFITFMASRSLTMAYYYFNKVIHPQYFYTLKSN